MDKENTSESPPRRTSEDIPPIDPQLLQVDTPLAYPASATLEPDESAIRAPLQPTADDPNHQRERQEVFELFHDALDLQQHVVDADDDTLLTVLSIGANEAGDALYSCLRQLFSTGTSEPPPPFSGTSIYHLDIKALDRTKISANM